MRLPEAALHAEGLSAGSLLPRLLSQCKSHTPIRFNRRARVQKRDALGTKPLPTSGCASGQQRNHFQKVRSPLAAAAAAVAAPPKEQPPKDEDVQVDGVEVLELAKGVRVLRGICSKRLKFDIEFSRKRGTTDNCYLIKDEHDYILVDVMDQAFTQPFTEALQEAVSIGSIKALVITHLTPRRVDSLVQLLELRAGQSTKLEVFLTNPALQALQTLLEKREGGGELLSGITTKVAKGSGLELGNESTLRLIPTPTPRWPDLLCAYQPSSRLLFTSKLFSAHVSPTAVGVSPENPFDTGGWEQYEPDWHFFYDCMLAPVARQASGALERLDVISAPPPGQASVLDSLKAGLRSAQEAIEGRQRSAFGASSSGRVESAMIVTSLCPLHGPIVQSATAELLYKYREWTDAQIKTSETCNVAVMYASAYGNTASLAQAISRGVTKAGVGVVSLNLETSGLEEVNESIAKSSGFVIGSPTLGGHMPTQVATTLGALLRSEKAKNQMCGVFGSFGWSGEAVDELESRLKDAGFRLAFDSLKVKFKPTAKDMQQAEESGTDLAQALLKQQKKQAKQTSSQAKSGTGGETEQAVGRLVGSLCAITARDEDAQSAMLASWISQASFDPPGLTVAVKRDRAVENLLNGGSQFVVNILAEGDHKALMKQLLKSFKPGEDRFAGLAIQESEGNGGVVLPGAASYVDCTVKDRMEAGDHYIVYAQIDFGKVVDSNALSAVHHRKVGTSY